MMIRIGVSGWMFLLVLVHPGCPAQYPEKRKTVVCLHTMTPYSTRHLNESKNTWNRITITTVGFKTYGDYINFTTKNLRQIVNSPCPSRQCYKCNQNSNIKYSEKNTYRCKYTSEKDILSCWFLCNTGTTILISNSHLLFSLQICLQCFDAVGWASGRASGL